MGDLAGGEESKSGAQRPGQFLNQQFSFDFHRFSKWVAKSNRLFDRDFSLVSFLLSLAVYEWVYRRQLSIAVSSGKQHSQSSSASLLPHNTTHWVNRGPQKGMLSYHSKFTIFWSTVPFFRTEIEPYFSPHLCSHCTACAHLNVYVTLRIIRGFYFRKWTCINTVFLKALDGFGCTFWIDFCKLFRYWTEEKRGRKSGCGQSEHVYFSLKQSFGFAFLRWKKDSPVPVPPVALAW